jgi:hypothetical protein
MERYLNCETPEGLRFEVDAEDYDDAKSVI